jgi:hypothetical protein
MALFHLYPYQFQMLQILSVDSSKDDGGPPDALGDARGDDAVDPADELGSVRVKLD